ncbi:MAG TPA: glycosyl hydrolase 53 family protein, partial [Chthonomonadales bacterium]|nr:glycosyl hydrolase 53 family protein [Chthonomonadales bacterium]
MIKQAIFGAAAFLLAGATTVAPSRPKATDNGARDIPFVTGGDVSLLTSLEQSGVVYRDGGKVEDCLQIFKNYGCNIMRLRIWVNPSHQGVFVNDLPYTIALGKRIKDAGLKLLLDFHYSDGWADPGKQYKPAAWKDLAFPQLVQAVHDYSKDVIAQMRQGGAMPDMVQVGNEITPGMLWPDGKIDIGGWTHFADLVKAGIQGVKDGAAPDRSPLIVIHIDRGGDAAGTRRFFDKMNDQGVKYDIIGESFYPYWHGPL